MCVHHLVHLKTSVNINFTPDIQQQCEETVHKNISKFEIFQN